jgi:hypothetical protein
MQNLDAEVQAWIMDAYVRNTSADKRVDVIGISMGGLLVRQALKSSAINGRVKRWFSVDVPHLGANLTTHKGIQSLIPWEVVNLDTGGQSPWTADYWKLFAPAAWQMKQYSPTYCDWDDEPENMDCNHTGTYSTSFLNSGGWPSVPSTRYAVAFGDGQGTWSPLRASTGKLYDFWYGGSCSDDGDWSGGKRDYMAGSMYLTPYKVNQSSDTGTFLGLGCGVSGVTLLWQPAFVNVDSALGFSIDQTIDDSIGASPSYSWTNSGYWTAWDANSTARMHTHLSCYLRDKVCTWIHGSSVCAAQTGSGAGMCEP